MGLSTREYEWQTVLSVNQWKRSKYGKPKDTKNLILQTLNWPMPPVPPPSFPSVLYNSFVLVWDSWEKWGCDGGSRAKQVFYWLRQRRYDGGDGGGRRRVLKRAFKLRFKAHNWRLKFYLAFGNEECDLFAFGFFFPPIPKINYRNQSHLSKK
jgi:hypothetical protein